MKTKFKKVLCCIMTGMLLVGLVGCSGSKEKESQQTLFVEIENAGYGIQWIEPLIEVFEAEHPGVTVKVTSMTKGGKSMIDKVISGSSHLDLLFVEHDYALRSARKSIVANGVTYDSPFAELNDIFNENIPGEDITIKDKMSPNYYEQKTVLVDGEEKNYIMPWMQAPLGIVVNNKVYKESFGKLPNTTDELFAFMDKLPSDVTPMIYSLETSYWDDIYKVWMSQYNGSENMKKFNDGYAIATGNQYVPEMVLDEGFRASLDVMEKLLTPENEYTHNDYTLNFTMVQNKFLEGGNGNADKILFMPNGSWLEREMEANYNPEELDISYMKTPIVSALGTKLGITDSQLSAVVDYVDETIKEEPKFSSTKGFSNEEVIAAVKDAREMVPSNYGFCSFIPAYSTKIDLAKEFLQLIASDRGIELMLETCGNCAPFKYDIKNSPVKDKMSSFTYSALEMVQDGKYCFYRQDDLFNLSDFTGFNGIDKLVSIYFGAPDANDRKSAEKIYTDNYKFIKDRWQDYLTNAGIK